MREDDFGDRMKAYEAKYDVRSTKDFPVVARIDGRSFSKFTKPFGRPFDPLMTKAMKTTTMALVRNTHAKIGYTQSDEITLIFEAPPDGEMFFDGRVLKLASVLASMTSVEFALECPFLARVERMRPHFDCRVFEVPNRTEAANALLWRAQDCRKNAIQSIARSHFSHKELHKKSQRDMVSMLNEAGVNINSYPADNLHGIYVQRQKTRKLLTDEEWESIPEKSRPDSRIVWRSEVQQLPIRYFGDVINREEVIFEASEPL